MTIEPGPAVALKDWLSKNGGTFHSSAIFSQDNSGYRVVALNDISADAQIVVCPIDLVITPELSKCAVLSALGTRETSATFNLWSERQWIATYLAFHWIFGEDERLNHSPYLKTLPSSEQLCTPLHFTASELDLFKGSNIFGATEDRRRDWKDEWNFCRSAISVVNPDVAAKYTWDHYLTAATYISSRAFPSSILSSTPTLVHDPSTYPVLIPAVDSLNHASRQPVSWLVTTDLASVNPQTQSLQEHRPRKIVLVHHPAVSQGQELFNNYGPKPNAELILGYGFSFENNPDDTIVLKLGGIQGQKWEVGRNSNNAEGLWKEILATFVESEGAGPTYEDILDASGQLREMVEILLQRLPPIEVPNTPRIRSEVLAMRSHYLEGQRSILQSLIEFTRAREKDAIKMAEEQGIELVLEED
ncbi:SET domain-containing protein [Crepidotus variabilis]|uniref:SET domain-containing protein n=1 Tax=Crepidotus variabilis TaxID=179855 RepID=A0A9P6EFI5_9AGAR|nr:SET domain-containing protein [Crepidotus variabilis]